MAAGPRAFPGARAAPAEGIGHTAGRPNHEGGRHEACRRRHCRRLQSAVGRPVCIPLPGGGSLEVSLLVLLLIPTGIFFTVRTRLLPIRLLPEMLRVTGEKRTSREGSAISGVQALVAVSYTHLTLPTT